MVIDVTLEKVAVVIGILTAVGSGAGGVLILWGNSKWATRKSFHDLANNTSAAIAELGKTLATSIDSVAKASADGLSSHSLRIQKLELEQSGIKSEIEALKDETKEQTREIRAMERHLSEIVGHLCEIAGDWKAWRRRNGPLNPE